MAAGRYFPIISKDDHTRPGGVNDAWWVTTHSYAKPNSTDSAYLIPNEWICGRLGSLLCLPVPPFALVRGIGKGMFASLKFPISASAPDDADPLECVKSNPDLCTGILLFDILIANCDRHEQNIAVDTRMNPKDIRIYDHERALFGIEAKQGKARLDSLWDRLGVSRGPVTGGNRHAFLDCIATPQFVWSWVSRISQIPTWYIEDACRSVVGAGITRAEATFAINFLKHRRDVFPNIISRHKAEFRGIINWGLLP